MHDIDRHLDDYLHRCDRRRRRHGGEMMTELKKRELFIKWQELDKVAQQALHEFLAADRDLKRAEHCESVASFLKVDEQ